MQFHEPDPTTENGSDPWDDVGSHMRALGESLQATYRKVADDRGPSDDEIRSALATLAGAWDQVAESVGEALRDPQTRERLKGATGAVATALGATLRDLGAEIGRDEEDPGHEEEGSS